MMKLLTKGLYRFRQLIFKGAIRIIPFPNPDLITGDQSIEEMVDRIKNERLQKILIVTDANLRKLGLLDNLFKQLSEKGIEYAIFDEVQPNPTIDNIENTYSMYKHENCQGFIAFGGGSPMDCAKVAACRVVKPNQSVLKMRGMFKVMKKLPPFYAVPTTAGTGSETTAAAVVTNPDTHEKFAIIDLNIIPKVAVLDPRLMQGLPPFITATTGMDALTHAVESYIGIHDTKFIKHNAEKATKMIFENIEIVFKDGSNLDARNNMALASFYAGIAFTRASVGYIHAVAHNLGGMYGVAHGLANAVILPYMLEKFGEKIHQKLANLAVLVGLGTNSESPKDLATKFIEKIKFFNQNMGIPTFIDKLKEEDIPLLAQRAITEGNPEYPVPVIFDVPMMEEVITQLVPN
ncbi:hypothetical protein NEF87_002970 [Candidatus Lokiarchaeum ossiferum]|uniref:Iron-containing alcohol dehydrogenase n=1 Tax=Candidatus Lokiarchaeum ossiferum TaxID=2951803 RepID=A0ABY6HTD2_9ARCH|nr:hypothetical protein NEF87_002970 [Candidatus Lokiarchaeum sp. B-35]